MRCALILKKHLVVGRSSSKKQGINGFDIENERQWVF
jgi:hypothetical protein